MLTSVHDWLLAAGLDERVAAAWALGVGIGLVLVFAIAAAVIAKRLLLRAVHRLSAQTTTQWDDRLVERQVFRRLSHLAPAIIIYHFGPIVLAGHETWIDVVQQAGLIYILLVGVSVLGGALNAAVDVGASSAAWRQVPLKSFAQVAKLLLYLVTAIALVSLVLGKSPLLLLSGLGAMTAVMMLVFRDAILGFVAGIQLSANQMVSPGDWIEMPKYGADGDVIEVALTTVKVRNWDKTITTIPTYALISESFKNWRGMTESGGRRIKRAIYLDMHAIRFCDEAMLARFARIEFVAEHLARKRAEVEAWNAERRVDTSSVVNGRRLTNVGTFRAYLIAYLRHHPLIHQDMTFLVRQLAPTPHGLPLEIYVFSRDQVWANYEALQADIFDHVLAVAPEFDLRIFQMPTGGDVRAALQVGAAGRPTIPAGQAS
jgi:miniconductance mechanosensitive channel